MTREEFLKANGVYVGFSSTYSWDNILLAMRDYAHQEREEAIKENDLYDFLKWMYAENIQAQDVVDNHAPKHHWRDGNNYITNDQLIEKYKKIRFMEEHKLGDQDMINDNKSMDTEL